MSLLAFIDRPYGTGSLKKGKRRTRGHGPFAAIINLQLAFFR
ncbi:MAG: hypothetical protein ACT4N8_08100 [Sphingosinicella sp.]